MDETSERPLTRPPSIIASIFMLDKQIASKQIDAPVLSIFG